MRRIGDAKYASEKIPTATKMNPTIDATLPGCSCSIGKLPDAALDAIFFRPQADRLIERI